MEYCALACLIDERDDDSAAVTGETRLSEVEDGSCLTKRCGMGQMNTPQGVCWNHELSRRRTARKNRRYVLAN